MARRQVPPAKAIDTESIGAKRKHIEKLAKFNHRIVKMAVLSSKKLCDAHGGNIAPDRTTKVGHAAAFLSEAARLQWLIEHGDRDDALTAAIFLGISAMYVLPLRGAPGKTLSQIVNSYGGHGKGGDGTKLVTSQVDIDTLKSIYEEYRGGYRQYHNTAKALFEAGIKGRDGGVMCDRSVMRHLKDAGVHLTKIKGRRKC